METSDLTKDPEKRQNSDPEAWRPGNRNTFRADKILNTTHFWLIVAALECARLALQFHRFIGVCAKWKAVVESAVKVDVLGPLRLMPRSGKNFLIRKNGLFFIGSVLSISSHVKHLFVTISLSIIESRILISTLK